jgi:hypothetical protein
MEPLAQQVQMEPLVYLVLTEPQAFLVRMEPLAFQVRMELQVPLDQLVPLVQQAFQDKTLLFRALQVQQEHRAPTALQELLA